MFRLTRSEKSKLVANCGHLSLLKFAKTLPYAFAEHGAIMAASVLNSRGAIEVVRAIRTLLGSGPVPKHRRIGFKID